MKNFLLKHKIEKELERIIYKPHRKKLLGLLTWLDSTKSNNAALPFVLEVIKQF